MEAKLPRFDEYQAAVQTPRLAFDDPELKVCKVKTDQFGMPRASTGGWALTYQMVGSGNSWAVRCFHKQVPDRQERYEAISQFLATLSSPYFVQVRYLPLGIRVSGKQYPITKMQWISGDTLDQYVEHNLGNRAALEVLATGFAEMVRQLAALGVAHGDLQHGNILVSKGELRLVDYDGMYVPQLAGWVSSERGHSNYQHPKRDESLFGPNIDRFSALVIYMALRALSIKPELWKTYASGAENMLFQSKDFVDPYRSALLQELDGIPDLKRYVDRFRKVCSYSDLNRVPTLDDFLADIVPDSLSAPLPAGSVLVRRPFDVISATDTKALLQRLGERIEVVGRITGSRYGRTRNDAPYLFLNFGDWKQGSFYLVLWEDALESFARTGVDPTSLVNQWVSVTGMVSQYKGRPQIQVERYSEVKVIDGESEARNRLEPQVVQPAPRPAPIPIQQAAARSPDRDAALRSLYGGEKNPPMSSSGSSASESTRRLATKTPSPPGSSISKSSSNQAKKTFPLWHSIKSSGCFGLVIVLLGLCILFGYRASSPNDTAGRSSRSSAVPPNSNTISAQSAPTYSETVATAKVTQQPPTISDQSGPPAYLPKSVPSPTPTVTCLPKSAFDELAGAIGQDHPMVAIAKRECLVIGSNLAADVTGDGVADELFIALHYSCGSCEYQQVFIFANRKLIFRYGGSTPRVEPLPDGSGFTLVEALYMPNEPRCCPTHEEQTRFTWDGNSFIKGETLVIAMTPTPTAAPTAQTDSLSCCEFHNYVGVEVTVTLTRASDNWNDTFRIAGNGAHPYCLEPGLYTYTISAPPPYVSINDSILLTKGEHRQWPIMLRKAQ